VCLPHNGLLSMACCFQRLVSVLMAWVMPVDDSWWWQVGLEHASCDTWQLVCRLSLQTRGYASIMMVPWSSSSVQFSAVSSFVSSLCGRLHVEGPVRASMPSNSCWLSKNSVGEGCLWKKSVEEVC